MPQNPELTSRHLLEKFGRRIGLKMWANVARKREERAKMRKFFSKHTLADGTTYQLTPKPAEIEAMKPTMFERLGGLFGTLRRKFEREKAKGK